MESPAGAKSKQNKDMGTAQISLFFLPAAEKIHLTLKGPLLQVFTGFSYSFTAPYSKINLVE